MDESRDPREVRDSDRARHDRPRRGHGHRRDRSSAGHARGSAAPPWARDREGPGDVCGQTGARERSRHPQAVREPHDEPGLRPVRQRARHRRPCRHAQRPGGDWREAHRRAEPHGPCGAGGRLQRLRSPRARESRSSTSTHQSQPPARGWARSSLATRGLRRKRRSPESAARSCWSACWQQSSPAASPTCCLPISRFPSLASRTPCGRRPDGAVQVVLPLRRADEIGVLARSFNTMAADLARHRRHFEELVAARTAELVGANARLEREIAERSRAEAGLRESRRELRDLASHLQSVQGTGAHPDRPRDPRRAGASPDRPEDGRALGRPASSRGVRLCSRRRGPCRP